MSKGNLPEMRFHEAKESDNDMGPVWESLNHVPTCFEYVLLTR